MTDSVIAVVTAVAVLAALGVLVYLAICAFMDSKDKDMQRYYREHMTCVKVNAHDYVDVHEIVAYHVWRYYFNADSFLTVILKNNNSLFHVNNLYLGNIIDYLYRVLDMNAADYEFLDGVYKQALAEEQGSNQSAGKGEG
jgi:hypothetical protein